MKTELYLVAMYQGGNFVGFANTGRPATIRVYETLKIAKKGINAIKNKRHYPNPKNYEYKIFKVSSLEEVTE